MPEATAIKPAAIKPEQPGIPAKETWVTYNDQGQVDFQQSVRQNLANAGIQHDPVPTEQKELPIHVPVDGTTFNANEGESVDVPDTFKTNPDNLRHLVDFTGEGAPIRIGPASDLKQAKEERNTNVLNAKNNPTPSGGIVSNFVDWLHDKKKAA